MYIYIYILFLGLLWLWEQCLEGKKVNVKIVSISREWRKLRSSNIAKNPHPGAYTFCDECQKSDLTSCLPYEAT